MPLLKLYKYVLKNNTTILLICCKKIFVAHNYITHIICRSLQVTGFINILSIILIAEYTIIYLLLKYISVTGVQIILKVITAYVSVPVNTTLYCQYNSSSFFKIAKSIYCLYNSQTQVY